MDNKILIRPTECIEYLGIAQSSFYRYIKLGLLAPDGYGKRNQPLFYQETLDDFCKQYEVEPGKIQSQGRSPILRKPRKPQSQGRSAFIDRADRPKSDEVHLTGAIIHWSERFKGGSNYFYVPVTCATCERKFDKLDGQLVHGLKDGSFTGCCINCYRNAKKRSSLRKSGTFVTREGYIMRHRLTFTPEEWEIIAPMCHHGRDYILEHRAFVAISLGRPLESNEAVHHKSVV